MASFRYSVLLTPDRDAGGFSVEVPAFPGVVTEGDTREEALANASEAVRLMIEDMLEDGESVPLEDVTVEVSRIDVEFDLDPAVGREQVVGNARHRA